MSPFQQGPCEAQGYRQNSVGIRAGSHSFHLFLERTQKRRGEVERRRYDLGEVLFLQTWAGSLGGSKSFCCPLSCFCPQKPDPQPQGLQTRPGPAAPLTLSVGICPRHWRVLKSIPDPTHSMPGISPIVTTTDVPRHLPVSPWGAEPPRVRTPGLDYLGFDNHGGYACGKSFP